MLFANVVLTSNFEHSVLGHIKEVLSREDVFERDALLLQ